jgi:histone H3/H4
MHTLASNTIMYGVPLISLLMMASKCEGAKHQAPLLPAGVKRISGGVYQEMRQVLVAFLRAAIPDAIALAEHCRRCTVTVNDILLALKRRGM